MRILNGILAAFLIVFVVVQMNDPDGPLWMVIYGIGAVWCAIAAFRPAVYTAPAGTYDFEVTGFNLETLDYSFRIEQLPAGDSFPYTLGDWGVGVLADSVALNTHTFVIPTDDTAVRLGIADCFDIGLRLIGPDGSEQSFSCREIDIDEAVFLVLAAGDWTLEVKYEPTFFDDDPAAFIAYAFQIEEQA